MSIIVTIDLGWRAGSFERVGMIIIIIIHALELLIIRAVFHLDATIREKKSFFAFNVITIVFFALESLPGTLDTVILPLLAFRAA